MVVKHEHAAGPTTAELTDDSLPSLTNMKVVAGLTKDVGVNSKDIE